MLPVMLLFLSGCLSKSVSSMTDPMGKLANTLAEKIADEGVLKEWMINADAKLDHPGAVAFVRIETAAGVRLEGVNGTIVGKGGGDSTRLPAGTREALITQLSMPISDAQRTAILELLGWNRTPEGGTPAVP